LIEVLKGQEALVGKVYTYASLGSIALIYLFQVLLILAMTKVQAINLKAESIETDNIILKTTLKLLSDYTDQTSRYGFCLFLIVTYVVTEAVGFYLHRKSMKSTE
jgi:hypothetical protein